MKVIKKEAFNGDLLMLHLRDYGKQKKEEVFAMAEWLRDHKGHDSIEMMVEGQKVVERDDSVNLFEKYGKKKLSEIAIRTYMNNHIVIYLLSFEGDSPIIVTNKENKKEAKSLFKEMEKCFEKKK